MICPIGTAHRMMATRRNEGCYKEGREERKPHYLRHENYHAGKAREWKGSRGRDLKIILVVVVVVIVMATFSMEARVPSHLLSVRNAACTNIWLSRIERRSRRRRPWPCPEGDSASSRIFDAARVSQLPILMNCRQFKGTPQRSGRKGERERKRRRQGCPPFRR